MPHGQWALLDADMPLLIDRSACLVEPVAVELLAPPVLELSPQQARPTPRPVAAHETHREASLSKVLCSSELLTVILKWPERIKTQPHDERDNCFLPFDSKGPCGVTVNNDIDDDSATKHSDSHTRNSHRQSV